jgi:hypothetical protein
MTINCRQCCDLPWRRPKPPDLCRCGRPREPDRYEVPIQALRSPAGDIVIDDNVIRACPDTPQATRILAVTDGRWLTANAIARRANVGAGVVRGICEGLVDDGMLDARTVVPGNRANYRQYRAI